MRQEFNVLISPLNQIHLKQQTKRISNFVGPDDIRKWTEQSFNSPPFSLAIQSEWLTTPRTMKLKEIYTNLQWVHIHRKSCDVLKQAIDGYWKMLVDQELGDGPVRILVEGLNLVILQKIKNKIKIK